MDTIAERIKSARQRAGLTMLALAERVGASPSAIHQFESGRSRMTLDRAIKMAEVLNVSLEWLVSGDGPASGIDSSAKFYAPVLDRVQAGMWADVISPPSLPDGVKYIELDTKPIGAALALELDGESMLPEFKPGDIVVVDTGLDPLPGDFVVALIDNDNQATFKKFRPRGSDENGYPEIELAPLNLDYPTLFINAKTPGRIVGTMIEHRRYRRRR